MLVKEDILRFEDENGSEPKNTQEMVTALMAKSKQIHMYMRKMAELDLRKQIMRTTGGNIQEITVPESKIKAYLANGSQKILQQSQQGYLIK